ncbi:multidrug transporter subunit MdtC, partial [Escherichia coli]|nr:multidrug transporter subunit MdtC [Escherichia coli]
VIDNLQDQGLTAYVDLDRQAAARYGITAADVDTALYNAFGQRLISTIFTQANQYRVVLQVPGKFQESMAAFEQIYLAPASSTSTSSTVTSATTTSSSSSTTSTTTTTGLVRLSSIARISQRTGALSLNRLGQF